VIPLRDDNPTSRTPIVTIAILIACVIVYFVVQPSPFSDDADDLRFSFERAAIPAELQQGSPLSACQVFRTVAPPGAAAEICTSPVGSEPFAEGKRVWLAVLTSLFLHGSLLHLGGNLLFLWVFANNVEDRLGHVAFVAFYLAAGVVATLGHALANWGATVPVVGASGAIAGTMGAYLVWYPRARVSTILFPLVVIWLPIQARWVLLVWFVLQFFTSPNEGIAWVAHVAGFVFGAAVGLLVGPPRRGWPALSRPGLADQ